MQPHYSRSSRENATPSNGTSSLAFGKGVPPGVNTAFPPRSLLLEMLLETSLAARRGQTAKQPYFCLGSECARVREKSSERTGVS